jgi:23S rRNA (cytidine1920-2'-O)/16S rRNA (cytidine1409-2'-O)-methyltransferase
LSRKADRADNPSGLSSQKKQRLDLLLFERGLAQSREVARRLVMAGQVLVNGQVASKPSQTVDAGANLEVKSGPRFVSRGGDKLSAALEEFHLNPLGWVCADVGASTGGFTDCLLQSGAERVYAIDVGYGQLAWSLRQDARVVVMERVNARYLVELPETVNFVCIDASFISLKLLIPVVHRWLAPDGQLVALIKPQFEAGREQVGKGGVVRETAIHTSVLEDILNFASGAGLAVRGLIPSPITGPSGNIEFLVWLDTQSAESIVDTATLVRDAVERSATVGKV